MSDGCYVSLECSIDYTADNSFFSVITFALCFRSRPVLSGPNLVPFLTRFESK